MPVKIRLARRGRKRKAIYDIVVADSRSPRDGKFIEKIGLYNPNTDPATITLSDDKALDWVMKGAQPTETARAILSYKGVMMKKHLQVGVNKGALTQEDADAKYQAWVDSKESQIQGKVDKLAQAKADKTKAALEAEAKVNQARLDAQLAKKKEAEAALAAEVAEASTDEAEAALAEEGEEAVAATEEATTDAPAEEAKAEEAPAEEAKAEEAPAEEAVPEAKAEEAAPEAKAEEKPADEAKSEEEKKAE
ncbi:MAG: 30S ribosomal protein S16 [Cyclobacteriaceae bacterium]